ncbi:MAG: DUF4347 domain-containing protein, partial [Methyloglobulus sp.]|nr:DUF4347 domain-containing protein [Methyloglobulus sp.]
MKKKSPQQRYNSKFILEELESRQLFSGGAEGVIPPEPVANEATVINVDANIEPVVESKTASDLTAIPNADSSAELINPEQNASLISVAIADSSANNPDINTAEEVGGNASQFLKQTQDDTRYQKDEDSQLANIGNKELLLETDLSATKEKLSDETLVNQPNINDTTSISELTSPELDINSSFVPSQVETKDEIIFVDSDIEDYQTLIADITSHAKTGVNFEVILLDRNQDGIAQITDVLSHRQNLDSVHLISHGSDGSIDIGNNQLNFQTLTQYQTQIKSWGDAFTVDGDFLIYGCNVAETQFGQSFINYLSGLTNVDIAASTDNTGSSKQGADWNLEYQTGSIEVKNTISLAAQNQWTEVLAVTSNGSVTSAASINASSLTWAHTVNSGVNRALFVEIAIDNLGSNVNSVTYGGVALTQVGRQGGNHAVEIWVLANPAVGTANIVVTLSGNTALAAGASIFNGVNQSTPTGTFVGNSGTTFLLNLTGSVTVASAPGDVVIDAQFWTDTLADPVGAGQASQWSSSSLLTSALGSSSTEAGAASVTMSGSASILSALGAQWSIGAVSVKASPTSYVVPVNTVPGSQITNEDTALIFSSGNSNQIAITDADAGSNPIEVTVTVTNGTLSLSGIGGLTFTTGDGTADSTMSFRGTVIDINAALNGLSYIPTSNYSGGSTLTISSRDNTLVALDIDANLQAHYTFNGNAKDVAPGTAQNGTLMGNANIVNDGLRGQVLNLDGADDYVSLNSHTATFATYSQGTFATWIKTTATGDRTIFDIGDGATQQNFVSFYVNNGQLSFSVVDGNVSVLETHSTAIVNDGNWHHVAVTVNASGNQLYIDGVAASRTFVVGSATTNAFISSLNSKTATHIGAYDNGAINGEFLGLMDDFRIYDRAITATEVATLAADLSLTDTDTVGVTVTPVNDAPVNTIPGNRYTALNTAITFSGAGGNAIQIADADAASNPIQVTLSVSNGTLTLANTTGLILVSGANGSASLTYSGTVSALNTVLNSGVTFNPTAGYRGLEQLTVTTNDLGNTGGSAQSDTDTINVHVGALVVTNLSDNINGNTASIANLVASDGGDGISLREAILAANATANVGGPDYIYFNITGAGPHTINLTSMLPTITSPVVINASSEPDYAIGSPVVVLNGGGIVQHGIRLYAGADGSTIRGLIIQSCTGNAIDIDSSSGHTIAGNWLGLTATGTAAAGNLLGINIWNSSNNIIGGASSADRNVISGNTNVGLVINTGNGTSTGNQILGNYIGTNAAGTAAVGNVNLGMYINAAGSTIGGSLAGQGNVISGTVNGAGLDLGSNAAGTLIAGNLIGLNAAGTTALGNAGYGLYVQSANNVIGGNTATARNIISGNGLSGINIIGTSATGNVVIGNYIGTDITGAIDVNGSAQIDGASGVVMADGASNNRIGTNVDGSNDVAERNIISGNNWYGVEMIGVDTTNNMVQGNYIGTDVTGLVALGNSQGGVSFWNGASSNSVGSGLTGAGNVISGNVTGILIANGVTNNKVQGNIIGLGADGTTVVGNTGVGVYFYNGGTTATVTGNIIGTDSDNSNDANERNIISANYNGIALANAEVTGNKIAGNYIGTDITGVLARGNTNNGVYIFNGANGNMVGGTAASAGNAIKFNAQAGIAIADSATTNNAVLGNVITENGGLGIDLNWDSITTNDLPANLDADSGANNLQNFPVLYTAATTSNTIAIRGAIDSTANTTFRLEFFNNPLGTEDPTGHGEGRVFLFAVDVTTNASGHADFDLAPMSATVAANDRISATATVNLGGGNYGSTSEFSMNLPATTVGPLNTAPSTTQVVNEDTALVFSNANGNAITVTDSTSSDTRMEVTLTSTNGILTLASTTGITVLSGTNGSTSIILVGAESAINNALNGLTYTPSANYYGTANVQVTSKLAADLTGYYPFNGNANDQSTGSAENGSFIGNATIVTDGTRGQVLSLGSAGGSVQINSTFNNPANVTLAAWVNLTSAGTNGSDVISLGDNVLLRLDAGGTLLGGYYNGTTWVGTSYNTVLAGTGWHHVAFSFDDAGNATALYLDGVQVGSLNTTDSISYALGTNSFIGKHGNGSTNFDFNGKIDDVRIYNRALGASEIAALSGDLYQSTSNIAVTINSVNDAPTFNAGSGSATTTIGTGDDWARAMAVQADGKTVVVGYASNGSNDDFAIVRYNVDGSLDTSFGTGGKVTVGVGSSTDEAYAVTIQADGKIIVAGRSHNGSSMDFAVIRLNTNGSLDTNFAGTGKVMVDFAGTTEDTQTVIVQPDGKIIIGGTSNSLFALARLNSDGSLDTSFGTGGKVTTDATVAADSGYSLALQSDGKILMAGAGNNNFVLVRYNSNGSVDTSFGLSGKVETDMGGTDYGRSVVVNSDGTILVSGYSSFGDFALVKYTSTGTLDTTFGSGTGKALTDISGSDVAVDMVVQSDGKIILGGYNGSFNSTLVRYNVNGTLDTSFGNGGKVTTNIATGSFIEGLAVRSDGRIVAGVTATVGGNRDFGIISYLPDGSIDPIFNTSSITNTLDGAPTFIENGAAVVLDNNVQIFDSELSLSNYNGATLTLIRNGGANTQDIFSDTGTLSALTQGGNLVVGGVTVGTVITNSNGTLLLTFNSNATQARVNSVLQQIAYSNSSDTPPASVQINWTFSDGNSGAQGTGGVLAATGSTTVNITAVNDAPVLTNGGSAIATETNGANPFYGVAAITDINSADFSGGTLTASISVGGESTDRLFLLAVGGVSLSGADVLVSGVTVGTWSGGTGGAPLVVSFNNNATVIRAQAVYAAVTYNTQSDTPTLGIRTITVVANDGDGGTSNTATGTVNLTSTVNDQPVFNNLNGTPSFIESGSAVVLDADVTIFDAELTNSNNFNGAILTLIRSGGANAQDVFSETGSLGVLAQGSNLTVSSLNIGTVTTNSGGTLVLTFNTNATNALVNQAMQQIAYINTSDTPSASVQINWVFNDGNISAQGSGGALTASGSTIVNITAVNDAPVVTTSVTTVNYTENDFSIVIDSAISVSDVDNTTLTGATVQIHPLSYRSGEDVLSFSNQLGITGSWNSGTGILTLSGTTSVANYQAALRSVGYYNTSEQPDNNVRTVVFVVNDGASFSAASTRDINVLRINDAPATSPVTLSPVLEDSGARLIGQAELLGNASDIDGDGLTASGLAISSGSGTLVDNGNGTWTYTPALN